MLAAPSAPNVRVPKRDATFPRCGNWQAQQLLHDGRWSNVYLASPCDAAEPHHCDYILKIAASSLIHASETAFARERLLREWQVAQAVQHAQLVPVFEAQLQAQPYWIVQPYLGSQTLADFNVSDAPLTHRLWMLRQTAQGLAALHANGWLHGDICPQNIAISANTHATLLDMGFARQLQTAECHVAETPFLGRVLYAAPELFIPGTITAAADMYSFGAMLCEMLTGAPPWAEYGSEEIIAAKQLLPPPDLQTLTSNCPYLLATFVKRLLAREPLRRPSAQECVEMLVSLEIEWFRSWCA